MILNGFGDDDAPFPEWFEDLPLDWRDNTMKPPPPPVQSKLPLKKFGQHCPKCEYEFLDLKYNTRGYDINKIQEYLKSTCAMCGYQWNMEVADHATNKKA